MSQTAVTSRKSAKFVGTPNEVNNKTRSSQAANWDVPGCLVFAKFPAAVWARDTAIEALGTEADACDGRERSPNSPSNKDTLRDASNLT